MKTGKQLLSILLAAVMLLAVLSGCAGTPDTAGGEQVQNTEAPAGEETKGETVEGVATPDVPEEETTPDATDAVAEQERSDAQAEVQQSDAEISIQIGNSSATQSQTPEAGNAEIQAPAGEYNPGIVLIKSETAPDMAVLSQHGVISAEPLYQGSQWYTATLQDSTKTEEAVNALRGLNCYAQVDYDYVMGIDENEVADVTGNPNFEKSKHFGPHGIQHGWQHINDHGRHPGGSRDVVVAVIDTGVDYNHLDLRNNIWVNTAEIPGNGIDDDGNGYIDDVNGWNCVGNNNDPMDDNGHGTHVAGIIAAENNKIGGVGVAYNCKIMVIKAGNSSGYFNSSDIAEAVQYAYMNGASVINMSFGGSSISIPTMDVLEAAYTTCVLVAAAGNSGACNNLLCEVCDNRKVSYPAALPYVIGVMSVNTDGSKVSNFSNYDHYPYNSVEYEVYAIGEAIPSTWPGNKYATLQGTSMAAPSVSGIAALLRSYYSDRDMYPTKFIQSQIVNTGTLNPYNALTKNTDYAHSVANVYEAMTRLPKPAVSLYDYYLDDSAEISAANNGDGVADAGETVRLYISLHNRGGVAANVRATIDTVRNGDSSLTDPYFTFTVDEMHLPDIGTYSVCESAEQYFEFVVAEDCPNDYLTNFNIRFTYENGLDKDDNSAYAGDSTAQLDIRNGVVLKGQITQDTTLTKDNYYIIPTSLYIPEGVTVTVEPGTKIQFWSSDAQDEYAETGIAMISVAGRFIAQGTEAEPVELFPSDHMGKYQVEITKTGNGYAELSYTTVTNAYLSVTKADHCTFQQNYYDRLYYKTLVNGVIKTRDAAPMLSCTNTVTNSVFYKVSGIGRDGFYMETSCNACVFVDSQIAFGNKTYTDCVFLGNAAKTQNGSVYPSSIKMAAGGGNFERLLRDSKTGTTYILINGTLTNSTYDYYDALARSIGGHIAILETPWEAALIFQRMNGDYCCVDLPKDSTTWPNGTPLEGFSIVGGQSDYAVLNGHNYKELTYNVNCTVTLLEVPGSLYLDSLTLKDSTVSIYEDSAYQLQVASVLPTAFDTDTLLYVSGDPSVATVSETGLVTPLRSGSADIYVYSPDYIAMAVCRVNVVETIPATAITLEDGTVAVGGTLTLTPTVTPVNTTQQVTFAVSDPAVASLQNNVLTAHKPGAVTVTATVGSITATCRIQVVPVAEAITFADNFYLTWVGDDRTDWQPAITPADAADVELTYLSSNPEIAYVDEAGCLVRVAPGNATIRASVAGTELYAEVVVNVSQAELDPQVQVVQMLTAQYGDYQRTFAVLSDHTLWRWGGEEHVPVKIGEDIQSAGCYGSSLYIVTTAGELYYYGVFFGSVSSFGLVGSPMLTNVEKLVSFNTTEGIFAITKDGAAFAEGRNNCGQLGIGSLTYTSSSTQVDIRDVKDIISTGFSTYFLCNSGELYFCGGTSSKVATPEKVMDGVTEIGYAGDNYDVVAYTTNRIYAFKNNVYHFVYNDSYCTYIDGSTVRIYVNGRSYRYTINDDFQAARLFVPNGDMTFIQTADGKLYGMGSNSDYELGDSTNVTPTAPTRIFFGLSGSEQLPAVESTDLTAESTLFQQSLTLDFNLGLYKGGSYGSIMLKDSKGFICAIEKELLLDKLTVTPMTPFENGEVYTLTIPANALATALGGRSPALTYTFTYYNDTPISLVSASLSDGTVLTDTAFTASFVYTVAKEGESFDQIAVLQNVEPVSGITAVLTDNVLTLSGTLDYGSYTLSIPEGALCDNVGGSSEAVSLTFTVYQPTGYTCTVENGQTRVDERAPIAITFTDDMTAAALTGITLTDSRGKAVALAAALEGKVLTLTHDGLTQGECYTLSIPAGTVTDSYGKGNDAISLTFGTYFPVALQHSSVSAVTNQFALNGAVKLYYNDSTYTLDDSKFSLMGPDGEVALTVAWDGELVTVTPAAALTPNTAYTFTASAGAMTDERGAVSAEFTATLNTIPVAERFFWTEEAYNEIFSQRKADGIGFFSGNAILNNLNDTNVEHWLRLTSTGSYSAENTIGVAGNYWDTTDLDMIDRQILDFDDYQNLPDIVLGSYLTTAPENTFPFVTRAYLVNKAGQTVSEVANETVTFVVEFNRDMDTTRELSVRFGSVAPYADYQISGSFVSPRRWEGTYTLKGTIEGGVQSLNISGGCAADDRYLKLYDTVGRFQFIIDNTTALAMNLFAEPKENGIELRWNQDDYETLMGYNIYRSTDKDGQFVKINPTLLLTTDEVFLDENAEPGKSYWYTFTVVLSDFTESAPAGKVNATALDTVAPNVYHTPVNQGYAGNNLVISCTASDNIAITQVTLYYRTAGETAWKTLAMARVNSKYSTTVFGSDVTLAGLEYYIEATDGRNVITKASADAPYSILVKDPSTLSRLGDVDGNNTVTTKDALMLIQAINGDLLLTDDQFKRADLNKDGILSSVEALRILLYINGKVNTLEM